MERLFIAINIPENIRSLIKEKADSLSGQLMTKIDSFRWIKEENWHFTSVFLGNQKEEDVFEINKSIENLNRDLIEIKLGRIIYGPSYKNPRMIWLTIDNESSKIIENIKMRLVEDLKNKINFEEENRPFQGHLTLARFDSIHGFNYLPRLDIPFRSSFLASKISLMKSTLKRSGAVYEILS